jgi:quinolinate synthase
VDVDVDVQVEPSQLAALGLGPAILTPSRNNGFLNMLEAAKKRTRLLTEELPTFPSLLISADRIVPQGRFAEAQAEFLQPDPSQVAQLVQVAVIH